MTLAIVFKGLAEKRNGNRIPGIMISQISDATFGNDLVGKQNEITKKSFEKRKRKKKIFLGAHGRPRASAHTNAHGCVAQNWGKKVLMMEGVLKWPALILNELACGMRW